MTRERLPFLILAVTLMAPTSALAAAYGGVALGVETDPQAIGLTGITLGDDAKSPMAAAFVGYRLPVSSAVSLSAEGEAGWSSAKSRFDSGTGLSIETRAGWSYLASARAAVAVSEQVELFGLVGYGGSRYKSKEASAPFPPRTASRWEDGLTYGGGVAFMFDGRWFARIEYRHRDYVIRPIDQGLLGFGYRF